MEAMVRTLFNEGLSESEIFERIKAKYGEYYGDSDLQSFVSGVYGD